MTTPTIRQAADYACRRLQADIDDGGRPDQWSMEDIVRQLRAALAAPEPGDPACPVVAHLPRRHRVDCAVHDPTADTCDCDAMHVPLVKQIDHLAAIAAKDAEIAALKADAERYEWIRNRAAFAGGTRPVVWLTESIAGADDAHIEWLDGGDLDDAIDKAMAAKESAN